MADGSVPGIAFTVGLLGGGYVVIWQATDAAAGDVVLDVREMARPS